MCLAISAISPGVTAAASGSGAALCDMWLNPLIDQDQFPANERFSGAFKTQAPVHSPGQFATAGRVASLHPPHLEAAPFGMESR
jgi:hypothetical protein